MLTLTNGIYDEREVYEESEDDVQFVEAREYPAESFGCVPNLVEIGIWRNVSRGQVWLILVLRGCLTVKHPVQILVAVDAVHPDLSKSNEPPEQSDTRCLSRE